MNVAPPPGKTGVIAVMGTLGDQRIAWDADDPKQVTKARTRFAELVSKRHKAFLLDETGKQGKEIKEFDPSAGAILMIPAMAGG